MVAYKNGQAFEIPDPTAEELAYWEQEAAKQPAPEPTPEERISALEATTDDIILMMAELIGGD